MKGCECQTQGLPLLVTFNNTVCALRNAGGGVGSQLQRKWR